MNAIRFLRASACAALCATFACVLLLPAWADMPAGNGVPHPVRATQALPLALRPVLYRTLAEDAGSSHNIGKSGCAVLPQQNLKACFERDGVRFTGADSSLRLHLIAFGRGNMPSPVKNVRPTISAHHVSYSQGNLTEWWRVLPIGFEQGFTVTKRPTGQGELTLILAANNQADQHDGVLGWGKLRYGQLVVTDAKGKVIPATLNSKGNHILIAVNDTHAVYPLAVDPLVWLEQKMTSSDGGDHDNFGYAVALDGATALIGAPQATVNGNEYQGAAYVFTESNGVWSESQKITANDGAANNYFGSSVALDGDMILVGASGYDDYSYPGAAYLFNESSGTWTQTQKLTASDGEGGDEFGWAVALEGFTALVGASYANVNGNVDQGAVYVFTGSPGTWTQTQKLTASDGASADFFGYAIALDSKTVLIGADGAGLGALGAAYVFTESTGEWTQAQKLVASDAATGEFFGNSVALDDATALIGAWNATVNGNYGQGATYIFTNSSGTWVQAQKLTANDGVAGDEFGWSVALDGTTALVSAADAGAGAYYASGAIYVFTNSNDNWIQAQKLIASDRTLAAQFGYSVALQGTTAIGGARYAPIGNNSGQGAAYFYGQSDLGLAVNAPQTVGQGEQYTSQTIANNNASAASPAVSATITVPAAASFVSATATQGSCSEASGVVTCDFGQIPGNAGTATANVTLKAVGSLGTTIENTASVAKATPALTASASTQIGQTTSCPAGYTTYTGMLEANGRVRGPSYEAPAGEENAILMAPAGFRLYAGFQNAQGRKIDRIPGNEVHRRGPAGTYTWGVKAGATGGAYTLCLNHP